MTREELKKEAEEYEDNAEYVEVDDYGHKVYCSYQIEEAYLAGAEPREKRIEELEKERENVKFEGDYVELENFKINKVNELKAQLVKAKEIIQTLIESLEVSEGEVIKESKVIKEIEQFLKEVDK